MQNLRFYFLCNASLSSIFSEFATSIMISCQPVTFIAVNGKSVRAFNAIAIAIASIGRSSCVTTIVKPMIAPPATGGTAKDTSHTVMYAKINHIGVIAMP